MTRLQLIVNPRSGAGKGLGMIEAVRERFEAAGARVETHHTTGPGHATELGRDLEINEGDAMVAVGGDGTMHELVNGLMTRADGKKVPVGLIAGGTGNSLMRDLDCLDPVQAADRILSGTHQPLDIARVEAAGETIYSFNIVGWGLPAAIKQMSVKLAWLRGQQYNVATVIEVLKNVRRTAKLEIDGRTVDGEYEFILGCNTVHTGMGMKIAPGAKIGDGLIDLVIARDTGRLKMLSLFPKIFSGRHVDDPIVEVRQARSFAIEPGVEEPLNIDGELAGRTPVRVTVIPGAIDLLV